ncbi:pyridoxamine 5'-phosphate oxidase family protein [Christiangramia salexigens]|uniref:General stress protein n=1 Tax=Christiangramia salexigens TaxID=1913577 RepID=A0A1L3J5C5_9FLAO|nr:pyridoxamine 5'-phosphate oxidase family protein [Christiangramia salexigens]APG60321.1 general stress protein [Christiangramia salexigens]
MSTKNMYDKEAREKIKSLVEDIKTGMLITDLDTKPLSAIPMSAKKVDDHGAIWFLSRSDSEHNKNIEKDSEVQLLFCDNPDKEYISIYGEAFIETNSQVLDDLYSKIDDAWFEEGRDDPKLTAIKVNPKEAFYWDTKSNKYISLFKIGMAAMGSDDQDIGEKGKLEL